MLLEVKGGRASTSRLGVGDACGDRESSEPVANRNRRTALVLVGWIALLMAVSLIVIWLRN
jgi:hypothetical protein